MGVKLCIHANGGYDVVALDENGEEGELKEYVGFALTPWELSQLARSYAAAGAVVDDFRSVTKKALADCANAAVEHLRELTQLTAAGTAVVEPEAVERAKRYANDCLRRATEESC